MQNPRVLSLLAPLPFLLLGCGGSAPPAADPTLTAAHDPSSVATNGDATLHSAGTAGSKKAERRTNPLWATCHASFKPALNTDQAVSVDQMAKGCAQTTHMHLVDSFKGVQAAANLPQSFHFNAKANHCYRAYAVAANDIQDLDLLFKDSTGAVAGEDTTDDPTPVVLEDGAVCWSGDDEATVVVSIGAGSGAYAIQVWGD